MLNISQNDIRDRINKDDYKSLIRSEALTKKNVLLRILGICLVFFIIILFLPWTQNFNSRGTLTTLKPSQRPQSIHSIIAGRIEMWYVQEGDVVKKGDTILFISEVKDEYFDPNLLSRTQEQLTSKELSVKSYVEKTRALDTQIDAMVKTGRLKMEQAQNKLKQAKLKVLSDSVDYKAAVINYDISADQYERFKKLYDDGLKSLTELEGRNLTLQKAQASMISAENKFLTSKNEIINAQVELISIQAQYKDYIAKAESEKYSALSNMYDAEAVVTKLQNQYMNYSVRTGMYYITAPQDGYVMKTMLYGIGEIIKEGEEIVRIMPSSYDFAVEMFVEPIDFPLLEIGQPIRIQFDGWPAIVFSGWPNVSYGTYGGIVYAIDNSISENGKFRVLVAPDPKDHTWPNALRVGAATYNMVLLKDVSIWYELWRKVNGFPPDYYKMNPMNKADK
jgi:adhesin transport system membrane fusion protein